MRHLIREPVVRQIVMNVARIEEGDQDVDVEQSNHTHSSSRSRLTSAIVGMGAFGARRGNSGTPLRVLA